MAGFDLKSIKGNDRFIIGGGALVLLASFFGWYGYTAGTSGFHISGSTTGWGAGFWAVLGILLCIAAAAYVVLRSMGELEELKLPVGPALLVLGASGIGALCFVIRWLTIPSSSGLGYDYGPRIGLYLGLLGALVQAGFAALSFRSSGETLPGKGPTP